MNVPIDEQQKQQYYDELFKYAANLMINEKKSAEETRHALIDKGLEENTAFDFIADIEHQLKLNEIKKEDAQKNMLYGGLWCVGGIVATAADFGLIFWGAIVFGAIQFFKGVADLD